MSRTPRPSSTTTEAELVRTLRAIHRLQTQARKLRRQLKANQADLRRERRNLRALQQALATREPEAAVAPLRLFAGAVGLKAEPLARVAGDDRELAELLLDDELDGGRS